MADIKINNISGADLFIDSESFLEEISNDETIVGGLMKASTQSIGCGSVTHDEESEQSITCPRETAFA